MKYIYCERWDGEFNEPINPLSEADARNRFDGLVPEPDHWFSVAALKDDARDRTVPEFLLEVIPHADFVNVSFLDELGRQRFRYGFTNLQGRLFMSNVTEHRYPADRSFHRINEANAVEEFVFKPEGYAKHVVMDDADPLTHVSEYREVKMDRHWERVPQFGDWEHLGKFDR
ncbi:MULTISPECIES: hypothetical protein [Clavibacter]|uniref:Uncharacterized protein n=1 Tax=Clavibacter tessellarius TaxID=31965 RepID=A0A154V580_9MICO|nr:MULTISPECIES: hypothetical protein [Clavibacter]KZC96525.1 hypothetical protein AWH51_02165 [Clavibacter michiganensis subsp. tessellarius]MDA3804090.1 hypothetical protein [Clavibacter sp. CT19]